MKINGLLGMKTRRCMEMEFSRYEALRASGGYMDIWTAIRLGPGRWGLMNVCIDQFRGRRSGPWKKTPSRKS